jgi:hypothetical protein
LSWSLTSRNSSKEEKIAILMEVIGESYLIPPTKQKEEEPHAGLEEEHLDKSESKESLGII